MRLVTGQSRFSRCIHRLLLEEEVPLNIINKLSYVTLETIPTHQLDSHSQNILKL